MDNAAISRLYKSVLDEEAIIHKVTRQQIRTAFQNMRDVYSPDHFDLNSSVVQILNFNDAAHRCAYLHKYAPLHTAMTLDMFRRALTENFELFKSMIGKNSMFKICSLGCGPGSDTVGCISAFHELFGTFSISSTFVDIQDGWKKTLNSVLNELEYGDYKLFSKSIHEKNITSKFLEYNFLQTQWNNDNVLQAVQSADLITMVKFISSAISKDTPVMIKKIFKACKPGSIILYIDHSVERYHQLLKNAARDCSLRTLFGPICHELYERREFDRSYYGNHSCCRTRVSIHMWQKIAPAAPTVVVLANNRGSRPLDKEHTRNKQSTKNVPLRNINSESSQSASASLRSEHTPMQDDCCCRLM